MPKVTRHYLESRRQKILDAALTCFARDGFRDTTIEDIAREAGVSHGAIYRYFPSKDDIIDAAAQRDHTARERRFAEAEMGVTPVEALDRLLGGYIERYWGAEKLFQAQLRTQLYGEAVRNSRTRAIIHENRDDVLERMADIVRRAQLVGQINQTLDPTAVARVLAAVYDGLTIHQAHDPALDMTSCIPVVSALLRGTFVTSTASKEAGNGRKHALRPSAA
jgi:AcrR family transcriptional regulator